MTLTRLPMATWIRRAAPNVLAPAAELILKTFPWVNVHTHGDLMWHADRLDILVRPFVTFSLRGEEKNPLAQVTFTSADGTGAGETFDLTNPADIVGAVSAVVGHFLEKSPLAAEPVFRAVLTWRKVFAVAANEDRSRSTVSETIEIPPRTIVVVSPTSRAWVNEGFLKPVPQWTFSHADDGAGAVLAAGVPREPPFASVADFVKLFQRK